jgi:peptidoglycan LD-endopeptidase LytH
MKRILTVIFWIGTLLAACAPAPAPIFTPSPSPFQPILTTPPPATITLTPAATHTALPTRTFPPEAPTFTAIPSLTPLPTPTLIPPKLTYVFPVTGVPAYAISYAAGGHGGYYATDIFAPIGAHFVAPVSGTIELLNRVDLWDLLTDDPAQRSGLAVAIIGDDGLRYYGSHLSGIPEHIYSGMRVRAGETIGFIGISGNARNTPPHLHFGISHPTYATDWKTRRGQIDPYPCLLLWQKGEYCFPGHTLTPTPSR